MSPVLYPEYVKCSFGGPDSIAQVFRENKIDVFCVNASNLRPLYSKLSELLSREEKIRGAMIKSMKDRDTFLISHGVLRLILANYTNSDPCEISFLKDINNKPRLPGDPIFFNLTHTKNTFAIAVSQFCYVGIDLEEIDSGLEIQSIAKNYFGSKEQEYIFSSENGRSERFCLLWTRKEAMLKALGTGIIDDISQVVLCERQNDIDIKSFNKIDPDLKYNNEHFIYSFKLSDSYLSIASPKEAAITFRHTNSEDILHYFV